MRLRFLYALFLAFSLAAQQPDAVIDITEEQRDPRIAVPDIRGPRRRRGGR